jgi:hypothetical protein
MRAPTPASSSKIHRDLFDDAGADAAEHVFAGLPLQDDVVDAVFVEELAEQQSRRAGADDGDLGSHFMPAASAMVSASAEKSFCKYSSGFFCNIAAPKWLCSTSRAAAVTGMRNVDFAAELEAEIEVLAQEFRRKRRGPVAIDQRRRFIAREHRAHRAVVEEGEECVTRHAHLVGQERDLDQVLDDHAEHDVVRDLADARELAVADIGDAARGEHLDQRHHRLAGRFGARDDGGELAGLDDLGVAAHRRGDELGAELLELVADRGGFLDRDGRAIDHDRRHLAALAADAVLAVQHLLHVLAGGDDGEQHVDVLSSDEMIDQLAADLLQRLGFGARAVPDGDVVAGLDQPLGHGNPHAAGADPADLLFVLCRSWPCQAPVSGVQAYHRTRKACPRPGREAALRGLGGFAFLDSDLRPRHKDAGAGRARR